MRAAAESGRMEICNSQAAPAVQQLVRQIHQPAGNHSTWRYADVIGRHRVDSVASPCSAALAWRSGLAWERSGTWRWELELRKCDCRAVIVALRLLCCCCVLDVWYTKKP